METLNKEINLYRKIVLKKAQSNNSQISDKETISNSASNESIKENQSNTLSSSLKNETTIQNFISSQSVSSDLVSNFDQIQKLDECKNSSRDECSNTNNNVELNDNQKTDNNQTNKLNEKKKRDEEMMIQKDKANKKHRKHKSRSKERSSKHHKKSSRHHKHKKNGTEKKHKRKKSRSRSRSPREKKKMRSDKPKKDKPKTERIDLKHITMSRNMDKIIDKKRLLEITKNDSTSFYNSEAIKSKTENITKISNQTSLKPCEKSISQFVELCRKLAKENSNEIDSTVSKDIQDKYRNENIHSLSFIQNVYGNSTNLVNDETVTKMFPVSSGTKHRIVENENKDKIDEKVFVRTSYLETDTPTEEIEIEEAPRYKRLNSEEILKLQALSNLGKFTGVTDAKMLTPEELEGEFKAWTRKDLLIRAAPITNSVGKKMLEKMGWKEGQGLGKNKEGPVEPIKVDIKINRKGLVSEVEGKVKDSVILKQCEGKHPVSSLLELCRAKKWPDPIYETVEESGPPHMRNFLIKVVLNNVSYQPSSSSTNKKLAKANAAFVCLQSLGFAPPPIS